MSFSFNVAITTPRATVEKIIVANKISLNKCKLLIIKAITNEEITMRPNACEAIITGDLLSRFFPGVLRNRSKLISIPDKNINIITPNDDKKFNVQLGLTILKKLFPRIIPVIISAMAVGIEETLNRAIIIGIINAANITINSDNCCIFSFSLPILYSNIIYFLT